MSEQEISMLMEMLASNTQAIQDYSKDFHSFYKEFNEFKTDVYVKLASIDSRVCVLEGIEPKKCEHKKTFWDYLFRAIASIASVLLIIDLIERITK